MHSSDDLSPEERERIKRQNREAWREEWFGTRPEPRQLEPPGPTSWVTTLFASIFGLAARIAALIGLLYVVDKVVKSC